MDNGSGDEMRDERQEMRDKRQEISTKHLECSVVRKTIGRLL